MPRWVESGWFFFRSARAVARVFIARATALDGSSGSSLVLCDKEVPFSENQDGDVEDNMEMMCYGNKDGSEEIEDGSLVSVSLLWCVSFFLDCY
jgi:hypothetical protein